MKYCFSTLGCPEFDFNEIFSTALDLGFDAIEIRGIQKEIYAPKIKEFTDTELSKTIKKLTDANLKIAIFTSGALIYDKNLKKEAVSEAFDYIDLAAKSNVKYVRVLADKDAMPSKDLDFKHIAETLKEICNYAKPKNVDVLIETNGMFSDSENTLRLLKAADCKNLFVIWDAHHTFQIAKENPSVTCQKLKDYIKHIHIKDSKIIDGNISYRMMGSGDMPVLEILKELKKIKFEGYISLEWVKRWTKNLEESYVVFPQFIHYMKDLEKTI
ncbi:MAG: sugar phosphate isomerase/epimerase [Firmicutes bacterium]|nr:sugar phosphate isomerase/epimerase [Bacillota bacterium]